MNEFMKDLENGCHCQDCNLTAWWMIVCPTCGNKRCPHANHHLNECTGSNKPDQPMEHKARPSTRFKMIGKEETTQALAADSFASHVTVTMSEERETPLTDANVASLSKTPDCFCEAEFARGLERRLAEAGEIIGKLLGAGDLGYHGDHAWKDCEDCKIVEKARRFLVGESLADG